MPITWQFFPRWKEPPELASEIGGVFDKVSGRIATPKNQLKSNDVLAAVRPGLERLGFRVEKPGPGGKVPIPRLYGPRGAGLAPFYVDAFHAEHGAIVEVEAGVAVDARKVYQDLIRAMAAPGISFLCLAVMNEYRPARFKKRGTSLHDYDRTTKLLDTLNATPEFVSSLEAVMLLGY